MILPISPLPHAHSLLFESLLLLNFKTTARRRETKQKYKKNKKVYKKADTHRNLKCKNNDDDDNDGDDIPEEIVSSHNKKQAWFSVDEQSRTGGDDVPALEKVDLSTGKVLETISTNTRAQKKTKMIEVVGGDDMDGLD
eukprot:m.190493 g.190493  ORF g.190493 m.190493 type:complete len:139 (+) comp32405_c11_seq4:211-627(+)